MHCLFNRPLDRSGLLHGLLAVLATLALSAWPLISTAQTDEKLTANELVARHLESIGAPQTRAAVKTRVAQGSGHMQIQTGSMGDLTGPAALASDGSKALFQIEFNHKQYPREEASFDGQKVYVPRALPGAVRTRLGGFLYTYPDILREGLFGSVLSTAWPLLDLAARQPELKYAGIKNINGRELHRLDYKNRGGGELKISLYFDPQTYRHVMTSYLLVITQGMRLSRTSTDAPEQRFELTEKFSDFRQFDGLTMPSHWTIEYVDLAFRPGGSSGSGSGIQWHWDLNFSTIANNQPINPAAFLLKD